MMYSFQYRHPKTLSRLEIFLVLYLLIACTRDRPTRKESRGIQREGTCLGMTIVPSKVLTALELGTCRLMATTTTIPTGTETRS